MKKEQDILKRLLITQQAPQLTLNDMVELALVLIQKVKAVNQAIEEGKVKGEDGYTPLPDIDYLSKPTIESILDTSVKKVEAENVKALNKALKDFEKQIKQKLSEVKNGEDAKITPEIVEEIKNKVFSLVQIPDVDKLLDKKLKELKKEMKFARVEDVEAQLAQLRQLVQEVKNFKMQGTTGGSIFRLSSLLDVNVKDRSATKAYLKWNEVTKQYDHVEVTATGGGSSGFNDQTPQLDSTYNLLAGDVDGVNTTFTVSEGEYTSGNLTVYLNGQKQQQGSTADWVETTPASGTFDFVVAPQIGDVISVEYGGTGGGGGGSSIDLEVEGTPNVDQTLLNLVAGTNMNITDNGDGSVTFDATSGSGAVDSVNGQTGVVVLDADDIDDTSTTNKFVTSTDLTKLSNLSGTNTGDQDLSGYALISGKLSQFASTTSSELAGVISDETGTGLVVFNDTPTFTTRINAPDIRATNSGGLLLEASNGTDIGLLGAGNTANVTWYGSHNFDTATQDTIAGFIGSGKTLSSLSTSTYPSLTELSYVKGVTSAIQTQLNAKLASSDYDDATSAETNTGTSTTKYVSPDGLAGSVFGTKEVIIPVFLYDYAVTTGDGKVYVTLPETLDGMNLVGVRANLGVAPSTSGTPTIQIARGRRASATSALSFVDVLSTRITIDANEYDSKDATTPAVIDTANDDIATGDVYRIDYDVAGTGTKGTDVICLFRKP